MAAVRSQPTGSQLAQAIRDLWDDARVDETLKAWSETASSMAAVHSTVRDQMSQWLDNLELAFSEQPLPLAQWLPILEAGLGNLTVGVIPPALDQVLVGAIDRSRSPGFETRAAARDE
jgi:ATP-dependent helicase/nuclease subunit B